MTDAVYITGAAFLVMFLVFLITSINVHSKCMNLEDEFNEMNKKRINLENDITRMKEEIKRMSYIMDHVSGNIETIKTTLKDKIYNLDKRVDDLESRSREDHDRIFKITERFTDVVDRLRDRDFSDESEDFEDSEDRSIIDSEEFHDVNDVFIFGYRWIFPTVEHFNSPVTGQEYLVVGNVDGLDGADNLDTLYAFYDGKQFVADVGCGVKKAFTKVYAYIRTPSSSDIMGHVFEVVAKDGAGKNGFGSQQ